MHDAPSVSYPAGRSRFAAWTLAGAWLLGFGAAALWHGQSPGGQRLGAMLAVLAASGLFAAWQWWRTPGGALAWDGARWSWSVRPDAPDAEVEVTLDLQRALLLRWRAGRVSRWIWLERGSRPERWDEIRRAVYSRARSTALQPAERPAAKL